MPSITWPALVLTLVFSTALALENPSPPQLELQYHLRLLRPTTHLVEVEITAAQGKSVV